MNLLYVYAEFNIILITSSSKCFRTFGSSIVMTCSLVMKTLVIFKELFGEAMFISIAWFVSRECGKEKASSLSRQVVDSDTIPSFILLFKAASIVVEYNLALADTGIP